MWLMLTFFQYVPYGLKIEAVIFLLCDNLLGRNSMEILETVKEGFSLVEKAKQIFNDSSCDCCTMLDPFVLYAKNQAKIKKVELEEFSEECVQGKIKLAKPGPSCVVIAGGTEVADPKTGKPVYFYIIKLYMKGMEEGYIYSLPYFPDREPADAFAAIKFAGTDDNCYLEYIAPQGESSSCNALKMDPKEPFDHRAAFLIGHMDEKRLWRDTEVVIADMFCKLAIDTKRKFDLKFEVSKFGTMTDSMKQSFKEFNEYLQDKFYPSFSNIESELLLENIR